MKKGLFRITWPGCVIAAATMFGCSKENIVKPTSNQGLSNTNLLVAKAVVASNATLDWNTTYQSIQGFGVFAGRDTDFFQSAHRDTALANLFGDNGLRLNMIRGEIQYTYPYNSSTWNVTVQPAGVDITTDPKSAAYTSLPSDRRRELSQLWILKTVKQRYNIPLMFATAWTPPLAMRKDPNTPGGGGVFTPNTLNFNTSSDNYAHYIAGFLQAYQNQGINFYGVSPANEPENVTATWANCPWMPINLGQFISNNLRPILNSAGFSNVKIISPECASWGTSNNFLNGWYILSPLAMDKSNIDIYATHGYTNVFAGQQGGYLDQNANSLNVSGKSIWVTEASDPNASTNASMTEGMKLGINIYNALTTGNANAYSFWLGILSFNNNESLIWTNTADGSLTYPKQYDVMGNFSRYIGSGYVRFSATQPNSNLRITAFKDPSSGKFSIVAINSGTNDQSCTLSLSGFASSSLTGYLTNDSSSVHWQSSTISANASGTFNITIPANSIVTYTGVKN